MLFRSAYWKLNRARKAKKKPPLELPVDDIEIMSPYELYSFLEPYVEFSDSTGNAIGPSRDREETEKWKYVVPDVYGHTGTLFIARRWMTR